ncbi:MAG: tetratricopeptide repeat protein [Clostridia bacterium]|nr:tetratricopeptide repeat protein [Clostridia bacterium]
MVEKNRDAHEPDLASSYNNIGNMYCGIKEYKKAEKYSLLAIEAYKNLVKKQPELFIKILAFAYWNLMTIYVNLGYEEKILAIAPLAYEAYTVLNEITNGAYEKELSLIKSLLGIE